MKIKENKDHYVARTYLKRFQNSKNKLYVCKKDEGKYYSLKSGAICCERGWDLMKGSDNKSWLKKILGDVEPKLNPAMTRLVHTKSTLDDRVIISYYLSILVALNPENLKKQNSHSERIFLWCSQQLINTVEDLVVEANPEITRVNIANSLGEIAFGIHTSSWAIIKNNTGLDFFTSDNPFYFLDLPNEKYMFPKYIALDPENLLFVFPREVNMGLNREQKIDFTNANSGNITYFEAKEENEVILFNINTIRNANRFIIMKRECNKLKKLISRNIITSTKQFTQTLDNPPEYSHINVIHCNSNTEQQQADMEILMRLFGKSRRVWQQNQS